MSGKIVKARKDYTCMLCGSEIKKGQEYNRRIEGDGIGGQVTWRVCVDHKL